MKDQICLVYAWRLFLESSPSIFMHFGQDVEIS